MRSPTDLPAHQRAAGFYAIGWLAALVTTATLAAVAHPALGKAGAATNQTAAPERELTLRALPTSSTTAATDAWGATVALAPAASGADTVSTTDSQPEAPSVAWLIAMPAVPILGGALIYTSRRLFGQAGGECRLIANITPPAEQTTQTAYSEPEE